MKTPLALKLGIAAEKYRARNYEPLAAKIVEQDYEDLMSIAGMIDNNEDPKKIAKAMWQLDTAVRDEIPDEVYYAFNE